MKFARIIFHEDNSAFYNMALDEAISHDVRAKLSPPTLRFYKWDMPSVSIGRFQKHSDINHAYCMEKGYPVVRRPTGGRAILHNSELTYSFSSRFDSLVFKGVLFEDYSIISRALISGLQQVGIGAEADYSKHKNSPGRNPACFKSVSYGEVTIKNRKVIGSAQKRYINGFLQQGSILIDFNEEELRNVLKYRGKEGFGDVGSLKDYLPDINCNMLSSSLKEAFESSLEVKLISDSPTKHELRTAKELESGKYSTGEWNIMK
jgi:lipoate-protein ligase A